MGSHIESRSQHSVLSNIADDNDDDYEETNIVWSNLIFLPFHPTFRLVVLISVLIKVNLGPIQAVYPVVYCWDVMETTPVLIFVKYFYLYACDLIYSIDTFLHMVHRQVTDKAMRREHLPKSALLITLDLLALVPLFRLKIHDDCFVGKFYPNIYAFTEFVIIYRIVQYFSLFTSHSYWELIIGFILFLLSCLNCLTCFWLLLTNHGLCKSCRDNIYDWRLNFMHKVTDTEDAYTTYVYGMVFVASHLFSKPIDNVFPHTALEFVSVSVLVLLGYMLSICFIMPKLFAESLFRVKRISTCHPHVQRLIDESIRNNHSSKASKEVENFYRITWEKRSGIINIPKVIYDLPRYLRVEIKEDLFWPLIHHSPTLKKASIPFLRLICECVKQDFKIPGEKFFSGSLSNVCYLKSGVVQILSEDEGVSPILSVTSGTLFGDISFYAPPLKRKVTVKCLTFCEVMLLSRVDYLRALHKFPEDRRRILQSTKERLNHARTLYACKQHVKGLDRTEDEGISWVKRRWWQIANFLTQWKKKKVKSNSMCELPPEEAVYHCAKYIGQLVLCTDAQLLTTSFFAKVTFPWILVPQSPFTAVWNKIVVTTVFLVLLAYPPNLTRWKTEIPGWFRFFQVWTDLIYVTDIFISLLTLLKHQESSIANFSSVMFARCKTLNFNLDLLATIWIEYLVIIIGKPELYNIVQFNRLIKIYKLFSGEYIYSDVRKDPMKSILLRVIMILFCYMYISAYVIYSISCHVGGIDMNYFFGVTFCKDKGVNCDPASLHVLGVAISRFLEITFFSGQKPKTLLDLYLELVMTLSLFLLTIYCRAIFISAMYLKYFEESNFQSFVLNLKKYYQFNKIHDDLMKRLVTYLECHWKYYKGAEVMHPNILKQEPKDIYWKVQGELAEKMISDSRAFEKVDPLLIKDLVISGKFFILPKNSTVFMFGVDSKSFTWVVRGFVKREHHNDKGELIKEICEPGTLLCSISAFLKKPSLRTYTTCTDCEIFSLNSKEFFKIITKYPKEKSHLDRCISEFGPIFDEMFRNYVKKHRDYQKQLRKRIFHSRRSTVHALTERKKSFTDNLANRVVSPTEHDYGTKPDSKFIQYWMFIRMITVIISIFINSLQGGSGAVNRKPLVNIRSCCDCITWIDIILKLFLAYYDKRGILIFDKQMCVTHYLTRGFFLDCLGGFPWYKLLRLLMSYPILQHHAMRMNTFFKCAHLYIVIGYFNYIGDLPTMNTAFIMILKWQIVTILLVLGLSQYILSMCIDFNYDGDHNLLSMRSMNSCWLPEIMRLPEEVNEVSLHEILKWKIVTILLVLGLSQYILSMCIDFTYDDNFDYNLLSMRSLNSCWLPEMFWLPEQVDEALLHETYAASFLLTTNGLMGYNYGLFDLRRDNNGVGIVLVVLLLIFWLIVGFSITMLILKFRGNTLFQHGVVQLQKFLASERVDKKVIDNAVAHFSYWWIRTKGINIQHLTNERIGVVFRQDLNYYFFRRTFLALDTLLEGGENLGRQLASASVQNYILPDQEILREMDLTSFVFVVHKGKIAITQNGEKVNSLGMGSIFGQLNGTKPRPVRISAKADGYADLLQIHVRDFQEIINDDIRQKIADSFQAKSDYMATKRRFAENANETIQYILRGYKKIMFPKMLVPSEAKAGTWYCKWLYVAWLLEPVCTAFFVLILKTLERDQVPYIYWFFGFFDFIHLTNVVCEFFTVDLEIVENKCMHKYVGLKHFKRADFYIDSVTLIVPLLTILTGNVNYQLIRLLRLRHIYKFHVHYCLSFESNFAPMVLKICVIFLLLHAMTCGFILIGCRAEEFQLKTEAFPDYINVTVDSDEWVLPKVRDGKGCPRMISALVPELGTPAIVLPRHRLTDYVMTMSYILFIFTHNPTKYFLPFSYLEVYYIVIITVVVLIIEIWFMSVTISYIYMKFRELYQYDYNIHELATYLDNSGLAPALINTLTVYSKQLWARQRGNWLPELAMQAPMCLREDLLCALYIHHLQTPPLLSNLPFYFLRQLAARIKRLVIFPGKCIIREGELYSCVYFIHEGEVEKWYIDKSGENRMMSLLTTNGYFGLVPGLFTNYPHQFSYYSRTVVDLVLLPLENWQDLLDAYPDIKRELYANAINLRRDFGTFVDKK